MLVDRQVEDQHGVGLLDAQLPPIFRAGSFDSGWEQTRFDGLLASGCSTGLALASCWTTLVAAHVEAHGGALPGGGALSVQVAAAGTEDSKVLRKPQHAFTEALELAVYDQLVSSPENLATEEIAGADKVFAEDLEQKQYNETEVSTESVPTGHQDAEPEPEMDPALQLSLLNSWR